MPDLPALRYSRPRRLDEALAALARPGACVYAGGTDLLVALGERRPWTRFVREVVDVKGLAAAGGITRVGTGLRIGALVTAHELATHAGVARHAPVLAEAARVTAAPALRRRGTVGGNLVTPHPAGDVATALVALGAVVEVAAGRRVRAYPISDFLAACADAWPCQRLVLAVRIPRAPRSAFEKLAGRATFARSVVAVAVAVVERRVQVACGGLGARPFLAPATAAAMERDYAAMERDYAAMERDHAAMERGDPLAAALGADCGAPTNDRAAHRLRMAAVLATRALGRARA